MKHILENSKKMALLLLCFLSFSIGAMEPEEPQETPAQEVQKKEAAAQVRTRRRQRRGYKIRCRYGVCRVKGGKRSAVPPQVKKVATSLEKTEAAKAKEPATFVYKCDKYKCGIKRKGLRRGKGKIRYRNGRYRIKGQRRGKWSARKKQQLEAYRKRLEATKKGKQAGPATYKLKCNDEKCDTKEKVPGKKWGGRHRGRHGRRGYGRRRTA
jgi:hypothetical protein